MTAQARHIVFSTSKPDATDADIERWAADRGCIVANIRQIGADTELHYAGKTLRPSIDLYIWTCDIVVSEGTEGDRMNSPSSMSTSRQGRGSE